ncbi:MAG: prolipoprotein diacylglyceryl transferase [Ferruginibacter sp.]|nr:prolipoprotein diacylglyceryl transferase [Ferruginibacter sp.]
MYPNLYYVFKDWFGVEWKALYLLNTFGLMVAMGFVSAAVVLASELKRKEKQGLLLPREEAITVGMPATFLDLFVNFITGFAFGYKLFGLLLNKPDEMSPQNYIFSKDGNLWAGLLVGGILIALKWREKNKHKLKEPEQRNVRIWPHDRVGDIIILGLIFGILGAKLFDAIENIDELICDPIGTLFSGGGLTFYGGLILAAIAICWYAYRKGIKLAHLTDAAAPALMIAYAVGRIGCQVAGDGDWGIYNSAYSSDAYGKVTESTSVEFNQQLQKYATYHLERKILDSGNIYTYIPAARTFESLEAVPHLSLKGPAFLPKWMIAYSYPMNVNKDGKKIPGCKDEHCRVLPQPVFPTAFYETVICTILFLILWAYRKRIKIPGMMFGAYLIMNGFERFFIEKIRVNHLYSILGFQLSQAEIIAFFLILAGVLVVIFAKIKYTKGK